MKFLSSAAPALATFISDGAFKRPDFPTNAGCGDVPTGEVSPCRPLNRDGKPADEQPCFTATD